MNRIRRVTCIFVILLSVCSCGDNGSNGEFEYVAIGASDTLGIGASPLDEGYVFEIQERLKDIGRDVGLFNLGIPDAESDEIEKVELPAAVELEPELVTVFVGSNDIVAGISAADFQNDTSEILKELHEKTPALIVIGTIPNLTQLPRFKSEPDSDVTIARINQFNSIIRSEAAKYGVLVVDLSSHPISDAEVSDDGFHPNDKGYQFIADSFLRVIEPNLPPA